MALNKHRSPHWLSLFTALFTAILLFWLSAEDTVWLVAVFGAGWSILAVLHGAYRLLRRGLWVYIAAGVLAGAGGIAATLLLMLVKTSLHGHLYPDYSFPLMVSMAGRMPAWSAAGALVGFAIALLRYGRRRDDSDDPGALS